MDCEGQVWTVRARYGLLGPGTDCEGQVWTVRARYRL